MLMFVVGKRFAAGVKSSGTKLKKLPARRPAKVEVLSQERIITGSRSGSSTTECSCYQQPAIDEGELNLMSTQQETRVMRISDESMSGKENKLMAKLEAKNQRNEIERIMIIPIERNRRRTNRISEETKGRAHAPMNPDEKVQTRRSQCK